MDIGSRNAQTGIGQLWNVAHDLLELAARYKGGTVPGHAGPASGREAVLRFLAVCVRALEPRLHIADQTLSKRGQWSLLEVIIIRSDQ